MPFATQAAMMGGNVRVGLEDSLYIGARASSRGATPSRSPRSGSIVEELGHEIATPDEARQHARR